MICWRVQMDGAGNGSLALIKALCLAGFAHHNLRMDCRDVGHNISTSEKAKPVTGKTMLSEKITMRCSSALCD